MRRILTGSILCAGLVALSGCGGAEEAPPEQAPVVEAPAAPAPAGFIDPNTAPREQLMTAPGVDSTLADALVAGRPYANMVAVDVVVGTKLTDEQKDALYARVWMPLDLNSATAEEILLVPSIGENMTHEFEEYRPWDAIERWRREMGKYVDSLEVARMEKYVVIR